jgi:hypothetical protein
VWVVVVVVVVVKLLNFCGGVTECIQLNKYNNQKKDKEYKLTREVMIERNAKKNEKGTNDDNIIIDDDRRIIITMTIFCFVCRIPS